ncbi:hypothetical protein [Ancylobacter mangrovi]|uniref:Uncharacterized protein n=1 Tax=Ancylobacter mangrovi TaxID=2972472 RepID=A0A9X2T0N3_9HYPH|nr:hypothetical protein [Ancylobacter mangrovi]MCS0493792.1 hypothetical protein [Ancylobacter mangrovi]MCS0501511.1 hypothetical protein [Ancylobacter mangrovi]
MPPVLNRAEGQTPAALRPAKTPLAADPRQTASSTDKKAGNTAAAPVGSIAAIESLLGF